MQARMAEGMLGLGVGEAALVPRVGEREHRGRTTGGSVNTDLPNGRCGHGQNAIADRPLGPDARTIRGLRGPRYSWTIDSTGRGVVIGSA
jgi:hypothetical protein